MRQLPFLFPLLSLLLPTGCAGKDDRACPDDQYLGDDDECHTPGEYGTSSDGGYATGSGTTPQDSGTTGGSTTGGGTTGGTDSGVRPLQKNPYPPSTRMRVAPRLATLWKYPDTTASEASQWARASTPIIGYLFSWSGLTERSGSPIL